MDVYPAMFAGRVETRARLDFVADPALFAGNRLFLGASNNFILCLIVIDVN